MLSALIERTGGYRARICEEAADWPQIIEDLAGAVNDQRGYLCAVEVPPAGSSAFAVGDLDVALTLPAGPSAVAEVESSADCQGLDWYRDPTDDSQLILCPDACALLQAPTRAEVTLSLPCADP